MQVKLQFTITDKESTNKKLASSYVFDNEKAVYGLDIFFANFQKDVINSINTFEGMVDDSLSGMPKVDKDELNPKERDA